MVRTANAVYVLGSVSREQKRLTQSVIHFCIRKLMPRMKTLEIDVLFDTLEDSNIYGDCTNYSAREMDIRVQDTLTNEELISTLCHEMVHVKQIARKEYDSDRVIWKGRRVRSDCDYENLPWEKEAFKLEKTLTKEFLKCKS